MPGFWLGIHYIAHKVSWVFQAAFPLARVKSDCARYHAADPFPLTRVQWAILAPLAALGSHEILDLFLDPSVTSEDQVKRHRFPARSAEIAVCAIFAVPVRRTHAANHVNEKGGIGYVKRWHWIHKRVALET